MGIMLILKIVFLLGVASESKYFAVSSSPTSERPVSFTTSKSKRDFIIPSSSSTNWSTEWNDSQEKQYIVPYSSTSIPQEFSQVETTVNTITARNPSQSVTYSPYQYYEGNVQRQHGPSSHGQIVQTTIALPSLQAGFRASQGPRQHNSANGFKKPLTSYNPQFSQHIQNKVAYSGNHISKNFANPNGYKVRSELNEASPQIKLTSFSNSDRVQNLPKFNSVFAARLNRQSPTGLNSFENFQKFRFNPSTTINIQATPPINSAQRFKNPTYKSNFYPGVKNLEISPISYASELSGASSFKPFDKLDENYQYRGAPTVGYANKQVSVPGSTQFKNSPQLSGFLQALANEPVFLSTGLDYQIQPSPGLSFNFPKSNPASLSAGPTSFTSPIGNYQPNVLPVHSSSSTAQLPQYKGASINTFANNDYAKSNNGYQLLAKQPQLHFTSATPLQSVGGHKSIIYHSNRPFEQIRTDVEVLNEKRPQLTRPDGTYEHNFDEDFNIGKDIDHSITDNVDVSAPVKNSVRDISFELPNSELFNSYDKAFGKYSKLASLEQDSVKVNPKPVYENDDDDDDKEDKSGEYSSSYSEEGTPISNYEDDDEEETRRNERLEVRDEKNQKNDDEEDDNDDDTYGSYGIDFEKDFEESYRKELPTNDYAHVKEVPEIEESTSESKKRTVNRNNNPKTSRGGTKEKTRHVVQSEYEQPKGYESYTSHKYEKPKTPYRDSEGHGTRSSYRNTKSSVTAPEDSYGYKVPRDRGTTRYTKSNDSEIKTLNDEEQENDQRKSLNTRETTSYRPYDSSREPSNIKKFVSPTLSPIEQIKTFTFPPFSSAKSVKQVSRSTNSYGAPTLGVQAFGNPEEQGYRLSHVHRDGLRYFANGQAFRDITGI